MSLWFILLLCHALVEPVEREGIIKETKRLFVRARTNSHCLKIKEVSILPTSKK